MPKEQYLRLLSRKEVEELYGITKRYLELAAARGDGPRRVYVGRLVRYRQSDIEAWLDANSTGEGS